MENLLNLPFSVENVEKVLIEFYTTSHTNFKPQLDQWLKLAQNSPDAWQFSWQLLDLNKTPEIQFFGASCLYNKVSKHFQEVPNEQYDELKNKILEKLIFYTTNCYIQPQYNNLKLIQRKLNTTLAKLALYLLPDDWENCIQDCIQTITNLKFDLPKSELVSIVLDLLTLFPEEYNNLNLIKTRKISIRNKLCGDFTLIKSFLQEIFVNNINNISGNNVVLMQNGIKCLTSWNEFGISFNDIEGFLQFLFVVIYNEQLFEVTCECLTSIFSMPENTKFIASLFVYMPNILNLTNLLTKFIESKDTDGCVVLTKLTLAYGENQTRSIFDAVRFGDVQTKNLVFNFMNFIMTLTSIPGHFPVDEESSDLTFVYWYTFQDELLAVDDNGQLRDIFKQFFINLLDIFIVKLKLANDYDQWSDDEKERLRCYRIDIGDTLVYMIAIIGDIMMEYMIKKLVESIEKKLDWKIQEALVYMLQSVVCELNESTNPDYNCSNDQYLVTFINLLPHINYCNKHVLSTTLMAVGSMGTWLEHNVELLPNIISLCLLGLKNEAVTQSASFALKDIINDCDLSKYADDIIKSCDECLKAGTLVYNYEVRLMSIIGLALSDLLTIDLQRSIDWINRVIGPYIVKLDELSKLQAIDKVTQNMTCHVLNLVSQLLSSLSSHNRNDTSTTGVNEVTNEEKTALRMIMVKLFPIYKQLITRQLAFDGVITDKVFESISLMLVSGNGDSFEDYINEITELIYLFDKSPWRRYTYEVCRQLLSFWWRNDKYKSLLFNLFNLCNQNAMKLLAKDLNWFHEHTDIIEQYCTCLAKLLKAKHYDLFNKLNRDALVLLLQFGQYGLHLPEQYTLRAVCTFMEEFTHFTKTEKHLTELMEQSLPNLIQVVLIGISGAIPRHLTDMLSSVLYTFFKDYGQVTNMLINNLFTKTDFPNVSQSATVLLTKEKKLNFLKMMLAESNNKRKFKEVLAEFSLTSRGIVNTEYAKDTSAKY